MKKKLLVILLSIPALYVFVQTVAVLIVLPAMPWNQWRAHRIYKEYSSAVWLVHTKWGYKIMADGQGYTETFFQHAGANPHTFISSIQDGEAYNQTVTGGVTEASATASFIREDGMLCTNLHVLRPWLYESGHEAMGKIEKFVRKYCSERSTTDSNYAFLAKNLKIVGALDSIWIIPYDAADIPENRIMCHLMEGNTEVSEYYEREDFERTVYRCDAAVFQTDDEELPSSVKRVIKKYEGWFEYDVYGSVPNDRIAEVVYAIGFPYGPNQATSLSEDDKGHFLSQIQNGVITQYRGLLNFGHNISSAPGMSGAPIINKRGALVSIHRSELTGVNGVQGFNQAVSSNIHSTAFSNGMKTRTALTHKM